ncbi:hypothetical protein DFQ27_002106 [Actinomortierella ambigua]|uniref:Uncharacterized protein n=1 Tax=Actinomortierella ambigua TaxID=1343610 RepID=A0A9P6Q9A9_9FUNG|nr:hypothetical protein DFQ27_002106 [Actinomortierella ambigua]
MDVCRMTQAYRQQHPGMRHANNKRTSSSPNTGLAVATSSSSSSSPSPSDEGSHVPVASHHHRDQPNSASASPSTAGFSIASMLPESLASVLTATSPSSTRAPVTASSLLPGLNMGELEAQSLLLRSMPMFGSLISRD